MLRFSRHDRFFTFRVLRTPLFFRLPSFAFRLFFLNVLFSAGCANAVQVGQTAVLDGVDLQQMTDRMAQSLAASAEVNSRYESAGPLTVVVMPVENRLTGEVIPRGAAEAFTGRVRTLLSRAGVQKFVWIMNRDAYYNLRSRELDDIDPGPNPEAISPQYALTATFSSLTTEDPKRRQAYYLCVFDLTSLDGRTKIWSDSYEVKKTAVKGFLD